MDVQHTVHLTEQGRRIAESTREKHCVFFELLKSLGGPCEVAAEDVCAIEHNLSPESFDALKQLMLERQLAV